LIVEVPPQGLNKEQLAAGIAAELGGEIARRLDTSAPERSSPVFLASRRKVLLQPPKMTIMVCTRERPERLDACLKSLLAQDYPNFSVLVVDNAPLTNRSKSVVDQLDSEAIEYIVEPRKGLCRARNRAIDMVGEGIVASIDDDEIADPHWLTELARGFYDHPEADAVAGIMVPAELETWAQVWFEQYGGFNKQRGFIPAVFSPATAQVQSPLYPLPPFGSGGNLAFRVSSLTRIGGFDVALGPGTQSMASEDTRLLTDLLCVGGTVVYQPTAVTHHFHRRSMEELRVQMFGYGVGLTAFYSSLVFTRPRCIPELIRLAPVAYRDLFSAESLRSAGLPSNFPSELLRAKGRGMLVGPVSYLRARSDAARLVRESEKVWYLQAERVRH
jgi:glycosyltransferase involved in cell wall biosynthesis